MVQWNNFSLGLWRVNAKDRIPDGGAFQYKGWCRTPQGLVATRRGSVVLFESTAHSLYRFGNLRWWGSDTAIYRQNTLVNNTQDGTRLSFVRVPPTAGQDDHLYVAGGGALVGFDVNGNEHSWGIPRPIDGMTGAIATGGEKQIDDFDTDNWTEDALSAVADTTVFQEGTGSLAVTVGAGDLGSLSKAITINLNNFSTPGDSAVEDYIAVWVRLDEPAFLNSITLQFSLGNTSFATDTYTKTLFTATGGTTEQGLADFAGIYDTQVDTVGDNIIQTPTDRRLVGEFLANGHLPDSRDTWVRCVVPKAGFTRDGGGNVDWADVEAVRFLIEANDGGDVTVWLDNLTMLGGCGMQGTYKFLVTYLDTNTGVRSNSNATPVVVRNVLRQGVDLSNIPVSANPRVNAREIWATLGNGSLFFKGAQIDNNTATTYAYRTADYAGLDSRTDAPILQNLELPLDNILPQDTYEEVWGPHLGRIWWCRDLEAEGRGRAYYSPAGRAEAVQGFVDVTNPDNPTKKGVIWNSQNYVLTQDKIFVIVGDDQPFVAREVYGAPGTNLQHTVVPTPFGIAYWSYDGPRIFDGAHSRLIYPDPMLGAFQGDVTGTYGNFEPTVGEYHWEEYIVSNDTVTLAVNLRTGVWRDLSLPIRALHSESDSRALIAHVNEQIIQVESQIAPFTDMGEPIALALETGLTSFAHEPTLVERLFIDAQVPTDGELQVVVSLGHVDIPVGPLPTGERTLHVVDIERYARFVGVRITGEAPGRSFIHNMAFQVRDIPLDIVLNGKRIGSVAGYIVESLQGIHYDGIEAALAVQNVAGVPLIQRVFVDFQAVEVQPELTLYGGPVLKPPGVAAAARRVEFWDFQQPGRLESVRIHADLATGGVIYQVVLELWVGEPL